MTRKLPFLKSYRDRHGTERHYFRAKGKTVPLPGAHGSPEFMEAYWALRHAPPSTEIGAAKNLPNSFGALISLYYQTAAYRDLRDLTKRTYRNSLERFRKDHGDSPVKGIRQRHIVAMLDEGEGRGENLRKTLRLILNLAVARGWIDVHPMTGIRRPRKALKGFRAWAATEVAAYLAQWPTGSRERLALALLLYTGQRRSDVITMGRQHARDGKIEVVQQKTGTRLAIPIHGSLKVELDAAPKTQLTFLQTQYGQPFSPAGFTNWFRDRVKLAGLPDDCTPHGLRKTAAAMLADAGCTPSQIMAITGHKNLSEVTLYTASADQERLASEAMQKVEKGTKVSTPKRSGRHNA